MTPEDAAARYGEELLSQAIAVTLQASPGERARLFEKLTAEPDVPYGAEGSHATYHGQGLRLSKYFEASKD